MNSPVGELVVFSAYDPHPPTSGRNSEDDYFTDYQILTLDGRLLKKVSNQLNPLIGLGPARVELAPGWYRVVAAANGFGIVTVPVEIVKNRVTTLHLEGGASQPTEAGATPNNTVRLPDGRIVGWRATDRRGDTGP